MNRLGAFAIHLGISLLVFIVLGYLILFHWYPDFFFTSDGGWQGIRIVALVDLVLGPVLTLIVYKKGKPSLKFDLTAIAVFQAICLAAGTWVVFAERPIAMVFADGTFQSMTADDYVEVGQPVPDMDGRTPYWVTVRLPEDPFEQSEVRKKLLTSQQPLKTMVDLYVPFDVSHIDHQRDGITASHMQRLGSELFDGFIRDHGGTLADYIFLPFGTRYVPALLALRKSTGELEFLGVPLEQ